MKISMKSLETFMNGYRFVLTINHTNIMKLTSKAQELIGNKDEKALRTRLALALNFTERWILKCIQENKPNGPLTTVAALKVIKKETGLKESELLEELASA